MRMEETKFDNQYWRGELARLQELGDNAEAVQSGLDCVADLLTSFQAELSEIDQRPEQQTTLSRRDRDSILERRRTVMRALCARVIVWSDWSVEIRV